MHFELRIDHLPVAPKQLESVAEQFVQCFLVCLSVENTFQYQPEEEEHNLLSLLHRRIIENVYDLVLNRIVYLLSVERYISESHK